jgi:hypothetical protein
LFGRMGIVGGVGNVSMLLRNRKSVIYLGS